jgi:hypothetical protein
VDNTERSGAELASWTGRRAGHGLGSRGSRTEIRASWAFLALPRTGAITHWGDRGQLGGRGRRSRSRSRSKSRCRLAEGDSSLLDSCARAAAKLVGVTATEADHIPQHTPPDAARACYYSALTYSLFHSSFSTASISTSSFLSCAGVAAQHPRRTACNLPPTAVFCGPSRGWFPDVWHARAHNSERGCVCAHQQRSSSTTTTNSSIGRPPSIPTIHTYHPSQFL